MRWLPLTPLAALLLAGCLSSQPYTAQDLSAVKRVYAELLPLYVDFRSAYFHNDGVQMGQDFHVEQRLCKHVDVIDKRDSIDPNVNLFQASAGLDNFCNDIESVYAAWEKDHHLPYDKSIVPAFRLDAFKGSDVALKKLVKYLRNPSALS